VARDDVAFGVNEYRIGEAEFLDGRPKLVDLALRMGAGIARIRNEIVHLAVCDGQPRS